MTSNSNTVLRVIGTLVLALSPLAGPAACAPHGTVATGTQTSCSVTPVGASARTTCTEWQIVHSGDVSVFQTECTTMSGGGQAVYNSTGGCDTTGAVAGCQNTGGTPLITTWFYPPYTVGAVQGACRQTVVMP
jgi:hypothetical protein